MNRRIETAEELATEVNAWQKDRNVMAKNVNWQFKTSDARIKLRRLYPEFARVDSKAGEATKSKFFN